MRLLLFQINFQTHVAYKVLLIKKHVNFVLHSSKHEELTFHHKFICLFCPYFVGAILSEKMSKVGGCEKKI